MSSTRHLILGIFFLTSLSLLAVYTLWLYELSWFGDRQILTVEFPEANGLRSGDTVRVAGMKVGRVTDMSFVPEADIDKRIVAVLSLETPVELHEDYHIRIEETTLLGGRDIDIETGTPGTPMVPDLSQQRLRGEVALSIFDSLGGVIEDNRESLQNILGNLDNLVSDASDGRGLLGKLFRDEELANRVSAAIDDFQGTFDNLNAITSDVQAGQGTVGKILKNEELYEKLVVLVDDANGTISSLKVAAADLAAGKGALGALLYDEVMEAQLAQIMEDTRAIVDRIRSGEGTVGGLIYDDKLIRNFERLSGDMLEGDGLVAALINDQEMRDRAKSAVTNLDNILAKLETGEGSLGKLLTEDELYDRVLEGIQLVVRSLEDYREAAPVSTFTAVMFGAF